MGKKNVLTGNVKFFSRTEGFGFVVPEGCDPDDKETNVHINNKSLDNIPFRDIRFLWSRAPMEKKEVEYIVNDDNTVTITKVIR